MAKILLIETSTALCSVALEIDGTAVASRRSDIARPHASLTAVFCDEVLKEAGLSASALDAVCISEGPGSYTGLRVGLSTAKGLCFGAGIKLLSVCSLDILAEMAKTAEDSASGQIESEQSEADCSATRWIVPMIDARRMEVYTALYDSTGERRSAVEAKVIDSGSFSDIASGCTFIGDGAVKCKDTIAGGKFVEAFPEAVAMTSLAEREYAAGAWRDVAYFEPFYLKDFVVTTSKKKLF